MYFVHSFYIEPDNESLISTKTTYEEIAYCSSIVYNNIFACQFHPEKSAFEGLKIYKNFAETIKEKNLSQPISPIFPQTLRKASATSSRS